MTIDRNADPSRPLYAPAATGRAVAGAAAFDRDFLDFATRANSGPPGGPTEYRYEYVLVIARKRRG
jgi:hypothetical protein